MKWIKSYKIFEGEFDELNRYGYVGKIIDIDKNELQECINRINYFLSFIVGEDEMVDLYCYKNNNIEDGMSSMEDYAYSAKFNDKILALLLPDEFISIITMIAKCLSFEDRNDYLYLLSNRDTYEDNGYSLVFTNDENFRTDLNKPSAKIKVPDSKRKVLIDIICYIIAHLENIGDNVLQGHISYSNSKKYKSPIFKQILIDYLN